MQTTDEYNARARAIGAPESRPHPRTLREKIAADKVARLADYERFAEIWRDATAKAREAAGGINPEPMTVVDRATGQTWHVPEGACGFAWVTVRPATSRFARWLIKQKHAHTDHYAGGAQIWVSSYGQSVARKEVYAAALAQALRDALPDLGKGIHAGSRLD